MAESANNPPPATAECRLDPGWSILKSAAAAANSSCWQEEMSMATKNRQILLASRPSGEPTPDNFRTIEGEVPRPGEGQMLLRSIYLSLDPYMRGRMNAGKSYAPPVEIGQVMEGRAV